MSDSVSMSKSKSNLIFKGLFLCIGGVLFNAECCIRKLWCSSIMLYNITSIVYNQYTNIYPLLNIQTFISACRLSVDRWNHPKYSVHRTFGALFQYLNDRWNQNQVSSELRQKLSQMNIIPAGDMLIRPGRLYFRLNEDLSPFMHEVPRQFGAHETFLKRLGVKETPSASDYSRFLDDLSHECRGQALNANELRAIISIIQSIAQELNSGQSQGQTQGSEGSIQSGAIHVPDEDSVLRDARMCLVNDDPSLRESSGNNVIESAGYFMLHPSIPPATARLIGSQAISEVLVERLANFDFLLTKVTLNSGELTERISNSLSSRGVVKAFAMLISRAKESNRVGGLKAGASDTANLRANEGRGASGGGTSGKQGEETLMKRMRDLTMTFVTELPTKLMVVRDGEEIGTAANGSGRETAKYDPFSHEALEDYNTEARQSLWFVKENYSTTREMPPLILINTSRLQTPITVEIAVSLALCKILGLDPSLATGLATILVGGESNTQRVLAALRLGTDQVTLRERQRGVPGERLASTDLDLVQVSLSLRLKERVLSISLCCWHLL